MSTIKHISLLQFRNYSSAAFNIYSRITCITGPNGSGKTNLLDAIYYLCYTKSYFTPFQQNSVMVGTEGFRLEGIFNKDGANETISCKWVAGKKDVFANEIAYDKPSDHIGKYAAVMIAPDDIELIKGGSEQRRKWIDSILGQVDKEYLEKLLIYQKVVLLRNAWLKMQHSEPSRDRVELDFYNRQLAENGEYIFKKRKDFLVVFLPILQSYYELLSKGKEIIAVEYECDLKNVNFRDMLESCFYQDMRQQRTSKGIHRDDWNFLLQSTPFKNFASQGQKKSFLFALKLAQYSYLDQELHHKPILLLDDIFEKLDQSRIESLLNIIKRDTFGQVLLTDTHPERVHQAFNSVINMEFINL